ncbi:MAG: PhzF family phenazine biosynthesis protein [Bacteroidales bacterium]|nr:PhzF family phenazine biosynthesis protein [Bacteroidales bacterium]
MIKIPVFQVDAFTDTLFHGNPAAVCIIDEWPADAMMQNIAMENNLAETAFIKISKEQYSIRWFTPEIEVDLCGHATLASAFVLFEEYNYPDAEIIFHSPRSGILKVKRGDDLLYLDFPTDTLESYEPGNIIEDCTGFKPVHVFKGKTDIIAILQNEEDVINTIPDFEKIASLGGRGLVITSKGKDVDFVSRFFAPQSGINEDPVTGSAHTSLIPYWSKVLNKNQLTARQLSKRGGDLVCEFLGERVKIAGKARLYLKGEIYLA